jgi:hypothetical protein
MPRTTHFLRAILTKNEAFADVAHQKTAGDMVMQSMTRLREHTHVDAIVYYVGICARREQ